MAKNLLSHGQSIVLKTTKNALVKIEGPEGDTCLVNKKQAEALLKHKGYNLAKNEKLAPDAPDDELTAAQILKMNTKDIDKIVEEFGLDLELEEGATLVVKRKAVIVQLELEE